MHLACQQRETSIANGLAMIVYEKRHCKLGMVSFYYSARSGMLQTHCPLYNTERLVESHFKSLDHIQQGFTWFFCLFVVVRHDIVFFSCQRTLLSEIPLSWTLIKRRHILDIIEIAMLIS